MKRLVQVLTILLATEMAWGQSIDEKKMNRDLEVAKNILGTLMKSESEIFMDGRGIDADYVEGYGVIFTIPRHYSYLHVPPPKIDIVAPKIRIEGKGTRGNRTYVIVGEDDEDAETIESDAEMEFETQEEAMEAQKEATKEQEKARKAQEMAMKEQEKAMAEMEEQVAMAQKQAQEAMIQWHTRAGQSSKEMEKAVMTFLADYADLIGQLEPGDKIMVNQESPYDDFRFSWVDSSDPDPGSETEIKSMGFSMEVFKKDITAYKAGKISLDEFRERVVVKRKEPAKKIADLEMFASIFKQYYSPKLSQTFFTEGTPTYETLEDFGVIFRIKTYSSYLEGNMYMMPVLGSEKVNSEERQKTVEALYPKFIEDIRNFVIDYGRTIRSLEADDILLLKIGMTRCEECSIPKSVEVSVRMEVLNEFDQQKLSREKALEAIEIKENFKENIF